MSTNHKFFVSDILNVDVDYIVNLTTSLIGQGSIKEFERQALEEDSVAKADEGIGSLYKALRSIVAPKVALMSSETLGKICSFGTERGEDDSVRFCGSRKKQLSFDSWTGLEKVSKFAPKATQGEGKSLGRSMLEEMAVGVIICFACDIILSEPRKQFRQALDESDE